MFDELAAARGTGRDNADIEAVFEHFGGLFGQREAHIHARIKPPEPVDERRERGQR
jgi:hypothetical protein